MAASKNYSMFSPEAQQILKSQSAQAAMKSGAQINYTRNQPNPKQQTSYTVSQPKSSGQVLGTSDANKQNGGWYNGVQYWAPGQGPQQSSNDGGGGDGGGNSDYSQEISDMYAPALATLNDVKTSAESAYATDEKNLNDQFASTGQKYNDQQQELLGATDSEENKFNNVLTSAYQDAIRAYNALQQQGNARFGRGNSAGAAVGELAQQEFFRQQGKVNEKKAEGTQEFATERIRIKKYITDKVNDLELYKNQALADLKKNLNDNLMAIQMRRDDIEANKTRDRLALLQDSINQTRAIQTADKQFRQNLGLAAVNKMQEISGRAFSPAEIKAVMSEFAPELGYVGAAASPQGGGVAINRRPGSTKEDEFAV